jgi:hypothetical protein
MESEKSWKLGSKRALAVLAKAGEVGLARSHLNAVTMAWAWESRRQRKIGDGVKTESVGFLARLRGAARAPAAMVRAAIPVENFILKDVVLVLELWKGRRETCCSERKTYQKRMTLNNECVVRWEEDNDDYIGGGTNLIKASTMDTSNTTTTSQQRRSQILSTPCGVLRRRQSTLAQASSHARLTLPRIAQSR